MLTETYYDIQSLIRQENIMIYFQPIISIKKKSLVGLEALCRGIYENEIIQPTTLFSLAEKQGLVLELDRLCRKKALEAFVDIRKKGMHYVLFINLDASIIDQGVVGSGNILRTVESLGLDPGSIVIEINESKTTNLKGMDAFINTYKSYGFMIALDDIGAGHSDLNRLALVKPDIIKVDMTLIRSIDKEFYKQEVVKAMVNLSRKIGSLVVAEGVETKSEAVAALNIGVDMLQGYYFSKPLEFKKIDFDEIKVNKQLIASEYKTYMVQKVDEEKKIKLYFNKVADEISVHMCNTLQSMFDDKLREVILNYENVECMYVLDKAGMQCSDTICNKNTASIRKKAVFSPAPKGTDHSLKDYYYLNGYNESGIYITEPYISLATGNLCVTISRLFTDPEGDRFILCVDAIVE